MVTGEIEGKRKDPLLGRVIAGRYRLTQTLGSGGMGVVYLARQEGLERDVVIKVIRPDAAGDPNAIARFEREARMAASVVHPHIVTVHDFGRDPEDGLFYLVMERLVGRSLRDVIMPPRHPGDVHPGPGFAPERIALEWPFATDCVRQIALALAAAHAKDVLHRDLKPSNVFLLAGVGHHHVAKVLDFGLAKRSKSSSESDITRSGELIGTVGYASPEQLTEGVNDARSDLFSLGVLWYELLTAKHPFQAETEAKTIVNQVQLNPPAPSTIERDIPAELDDMVMRLLRKEPSARTSSAEELMQALDALPDPRGVPGSSAGAAPTPGDATRRIAQLRPRVAPKKRSRFPVAVATVIAGVALVVAIVAAVAPAPAPPTVAAVTHTEVAARSLLPLRPRPDLDDAGKRLVVLGRALYHDPILSGPNSISCATCHPMEGGGTTPEPTTRLGSTGDPGKWNTPTTWNATIIYRQTWRGDVESIPEVLVRPLFNPTMMAAKNWPEIEAELRSSPRHIALFDEASVPIERSAIERALVTYIDQAAPRNAPFDRYLRGDANAIDPVAAAGAERFQSLGCAACHQGEGIGGNMRARFGVLAGAHPYAARGKCSDGTYCRSDEGCGQGLAPERAVLEKCAHSDEIREEDNGFKADDPTQNPTFMFKVPSLRNVGRTAPYFHDGSARSLPEAVRTMGTLQLGATLSNDDVSKLVAFLDSLSGTLADEELRLSADATRVARTP